jgi:hypothetical protein
MTDADDARSFASWAVSSRGWSWSRGSFAAAVFAAAVAFAVVAFWGCSSVAISSTRYRTSPGTRNAIAIAKTRKDERGCGQRPSIVAPARMLLLRLEAVIPRMDASTDARANNDGGGGGSMARAPKWRRRKDKGIAERETNEKRCVGGCYQEEDHEPPHGHCSDPGATETETETPTATPNHLLVHCLVLSGIVWYCFVSFRCIEN